MLFLVGLELEPRRLWNLRRPIFGWGSVQLLGSAALVLALGVAVGVDWRVALVAGLGLACHRPRSAWACSPNAT